MPNLRPRRIGSVVFARFQNRDDGVVSITGSVTTLNNDEFENRGFERVVPSTSMMTLVEMVKFSRDCLKTKQAFKFRCEF